MASLGMQEKAARYLLEGSVKAVKVDTHECLFLVQGSATHPYTTRYRNGMWRCDCPAQTPTCAHVIACSQVTHFDIGGKPSIASDPDAEIDELLKEDASVELSGLDPYAEH